MELIIAFIIFACSIFVHELGHILIGWYFSKEIPTIRFRNMGVMIIPKTVYSFRQKQVFLGTAIILGMVSIYPFFLYFPMESWIALVAYFVSCGADFYTLIKLEVNK